MNRILVGLVAKRTKESVLNECKKVIEYLGSKSISLVVTKELNKELSANNYANVIVVDAVKDVVQYKDLAVVLVLGGDGTIISAARCSQSTSAPILPVNMGNLGFLSEIGPNELYQSLDTVLAGKSRTISRAIADVLVIQEGVQIFSGRAVNDVVVSKSAIARIFGLNLNINGVRAAYIKGDGVIVATPLGSTAYSMSAGGSIVHPEVDAMLITPICSHSLTARPLVVQGNSEIQLELEFNLKDPQELTLTLDGQETVTLCKDTLINVKLSEEKARFFSSGKSYYDILAGKLKWATHG